MCNHSRFDIYIELQPNFTLKFINELFHIQADNFYSRFIRQNRQFMKYLEPGFKIYGLWHQKPMASCFLTDKYYYCIAMIIEVVHPKF